jgi:hypothetical protein
MHEHIEDEQILCSALGIQPGELDHVAAAKEQLRRLGYEPEDL